MAKLKVPSLQHLARNWEDSPEKIGRKLVKLVQHPPTFSYQQLFPLVQDLLVLHQPLEEILKAVRLHVKQEVARNNYLELLPLIHAHFSAEPPDFVQAVTGRMYPIARGLMVPFSPPLVYGRDGKLIFPWFSFWRSNPLASKELSLFITCVEEILLEDPDFDGAEFHVLDFSAASKSEGRRLRVIEARNIERLSQSEKVRMLEIFSAGYFLAESELSRQKKSAEGSAKNIRDDNQPDLFTDK